MDNILERLVKYKIKVSSQTFITDYLCSSVAHIAIPTAFCFCSQFFWLSSKTLLYLIQAVRLGHPARVMEKIHSYSLDAILDSSHETAIVKDVRRDIDATLVCVGSG